MSEIRTQRNHLDKKFYLEKFLRLWPPHIALIRAFEAANLKKNLSIKYPSLDLGCGNGKFSKIVFGKFDVGIDINEKEIKRAYKSGTYSKLHCCDAHYLPFPDKKFNTIVSNCVLEHISHPEILIKEISRVLRYKGVFFFTTWTPDFNQSLLSKKKWYVRWKNKKLNHVSIKSVHKWQEILKKNNLQLVWTKYYLDHQQLKWLDLLELISLIGFWKFKMINLYKIFAPSFPSLLINKVGKTLNFKEDPNSKKGCAVAIKAIKIS